jgi:hypothetical protein
MSSAILKQDLVDILKSGMWDYDLDPWGTTVATMFHICDALYVTGFKRYIPGELGYRPGLNASWGELESDVQISLVELINDDPHERAPEMLRKWLVTLNADRELFVADGQSY